ncbi:hypothetical protein CBR_g8549 [Chara braunii]|uniref:Prenylcysteine lyase domain-containing protein n=1 Tax=Chara braunii TaxID=69332 RepID=A0A388KMF8_CHABU|nr:hypothetical protein CBR_g8549 [Chara braunii]|eukprot:GBG71246.1 hypothetical protein CBR_g8549 [Chara braunii]
MNTRGACLPRVAFGMAAAMLLSVCFSWFCLVALTCHAVDVRQSDGKLKIAIIGSGISGTSTAYFLSNGGKDDGGGGDLYEIHVYERSAMVGGRVAMVNLSSYGGHVFESGASIIHIKNRYMKQFAAELGLRPAVSPVEGRSLGIFDGQKFVLKLGCSSSSAGGKSWIGTLSKWKNAGTMGLRYGGSLIRLRSYVKGEANLKLVEMNTRGACLPRVAFGMAAAMLLSVCFSWFCLVALTCHAVDVRQSDGKLKIAIIGSGISGTSTAYFLSNGGKDDGGGGDLYEIHVYERSAMVGGRVAMVNLSSYGGHVFESGASIIHIKNRYMKQFAAELGLRPAVSPVEGRSLGIFDGQKFVLKLGCSSSSAGGKSWIGTLSKWKNAGTMGLRYGGSLIRFGSYVKGVSNFVTAGARAANINHTSEACTTEGMPVAGHDDCGAFTIKTK